MSTITGDDLLLTMIMWNCKGDGDKKLLKYIYIIFHEADLNFLHNLLLEEKLITSANLFGKKIMKYLCVQKRKQVNCLHRLYIAAAFDCAARRGIRLWFKVFDFRCIRDALFTLHINFRLSSCHALGCTMGCGWEDCIFQKIIDYKACK